MTTLRMNSRITQLVSSYATIVCIFGCLMAPAGAGAQMLYMEPEIRAALSERNQYFAAAGISSDAHVSGFNTSRDINRLQKWLRQNPSPQNYWYLFLSGICEQTNKDSRGGYFSRALSAASDSPGVLWLLQFEFRRNNLYTWSAQALEILEKYFTASGASRALTISQPLLDIYVHRNQSENSKLTVDDITAFDSQTLWPQIHGALAALPFEPGKFFRIISLITQKVRHSWWLQLVLADRLVRVLSLMSIFIIAAIFVAVSINRFGVAIHGIFEIFPRAIPPFIRYALISAIILSLLSFGLHLLFWLLAYLIWEQLDKKQKGLFTICLVLVTISPFWSLVSGFSQALLHPANAPRLYMRAVTEGYSTSLDQRTYRYTQSNPDDGLGYLARSMLLYKHGAYASAGKQLEKAEGLLPLDPVILQMKGILQYHQGNTRAALRELKNARVRYSGASDISYNLGSLYIKELNSVEGMKYITEATRFHESRVNAFSQYNESHFTQGLPALREFLQPDYEPVYFWKNIFPQYFSLFRAENARWGMAFLGFGPGASFIIFIILFLILELHFQELFMNSVKFRNALFWVPPEKKFHRTQRCDVCGKAICHSCGRGVFCKNCHHKINEAADVQKRNRKKDELRIYFKKVMRTKSHYFDIFFPGVGMLYNPEYNPYIAFLFIFVTSFLYSFIAGTFLFHYSYPVWVGQKPLLVSGTIVLLYLSFFIITAFKQTSRIWTPKEKHRGFKR